MNYVAYGDRMLQKKRKFENKLYLFDVIKKANFIKLTALDLAEYI